MSKNREHAVKKRLTSDGVGAFVYADGPSSAVGSANSLLMVGLSFSMTKYEDPGEYNDDIRDAMKRDLKELTDSGRRVLVFVQWEIADSIADDDCFPGGFVDRDHVCEPHAFEPIHVLQPRKMLAMIHASTMKPESPLGILTTKFRRLWEMTGVHFAELSSEGDDNLRRRLAANLNGVLTDPDFFRDFVGKLHLNDLPRQLRGRTWWERRELPATGSRVRDYQRRRLGTFVLEALFSDDVLRPTEYISTRSVLDAMTLQTQLERFVPERVFVYGHEAHTPRVRWQFLERSWHRPADVAWAPDWSLDPSKVIIRGGSDRWGQKANAQDWTDSEANWNLYNGIEAAH